MAQKRKIGVFVCYCWGNISDYVNCERVRDTIEHDDSVVVAKTTMFACSDAAQQEMIDDMRQTIKDFTGHAPQSDDITMLAVYLG